jgi:hypothetical protein
MTHTLRLNCACLFLLAIHAQAQVHWAKTFGGAIDGYAGHGLVLAVSDDSSIYATGGFQGTIDAGGNSLTANSTGSDVLVLKLNSGGEVLWAKAFGGTAFMYDWEYGRHVAVDELHDQIVVGGEIHTLFTLDTIVFNGLTTSTGGNAFLACFDEDGNVRWGRAIKCSSGFTSLLDMHVSNTGVTYGFGYLTCQTQAPGSVPQTIGPGGFIVKYDSNGDLLDAETPAQQGAGISAVAWLSATEWLMVGEAIGPQATIYGQPIAPPPGQNYIGYLVRTDTLGNVQWSKLLPSSTGSTCYAVAHDPGGLSYLLGNYVTDVVLDGDTLYPASGTFGYFLAALDAQGSFQWVVPFSGSQSSDRRIGLAPDGSVYVSGTQLNDTLWIGTTPYPPLSDVDHYVAHIGTQGQMLGLLRSPNSGSTYASVLPTADALYLSFAFDTTLQFVDTTVINPGGSNYSFLLAKLGELNWTTSIRSMESTTGELHIYANPNNGLCTIDLPEELRLTDDLMLSVFDNTGQLVQRVPLRYNEQGVRLDIRAQARGIYHVELGDGQQRYTGTIVFE